MGNAESGEKDGKGYKPVEKEEPGGWFGAR
jgi:hypothetical protein